MPQETTALPDFVTGWGNSIIEIEPTYLYVIESASKPDRIKIGVARDPLKRLTAIDASRYSLPLPYDIRHLFLMEDAHQIEKCAQIHLWRQGRWFWGELFDCPPDEAAALIRSLVADHDTFRKAMKFDQAVAMLDKLKVSGETWSVFDVPRSDPIFTKAAQRYARSAAKKAKLVDEGWNGFYRIEQHRSWYQD